MILLFLWRLGGKQYSWFAYPVRGRKLKTLQKYSIFKPVSDDNLELTKYEKQKKSFFRTNHMLTICGIMSTVANNFSRQF